MADAPEKSSTEPQAPPLTEMVKVKIDHEEREVPFGELVATYQKTQGIARIEDKKKELAAQKQELSLLKEVNDLIGVAKTDADLAARLDEIVDHVRNGAPRPKWASGRTQRADEDDVSDATQGGLSEDQIKALQLQLNQVRSKVETREAKEEKRDFENSLKSALSEIPLFSETPGMSQVGANLARELLRGDSTLSVKDAAQSARELITGALEEKATREKEALDRQRREYASVPPGTGSPRITPQKKPTYADFKKGTMFSDLTERISQAFQ